MGDTQNGDNEGQGQQSAGDLRTQLEAEKEKNKQLAATNETYKQKEQLDTLGLGHLSDRQRRVLIRELKDEGKGLDDATSVASVVTDLGLPAEPPKPPGQGNDNGNDDGQQQQQQQEEDEEIEGALSAVALMQRAHRMSASTEVKTDFETQMKDTKSKEELRDLIRSKGPRHGIVHEWDVP